MPGGAIGASMGQDQRRLALLAALMGAGAHAFAGYTVATHERPPAWLGWVVFVGSSLQVAGLLWLATAPSQLGD